MQGAKEKSQMFLDTIRLKPDELRSILAHTYVWHMIATVCLNLLKPTFQTYMIDTPY